MDEEAPADEAERGFNVVMSGQLSSVQVTTRFMQQRFCKAQRTRRRTLLPGVLLWAISSMQLLHKRLAKSVHQKGPNPHTVQAFVTRTLRC